MSFPIAWIKHTFQAGEVMPPHEHECPQLLYSFQGLTRIETQKHIWVVPQNFAVWLPANFLHETRTITSGCSHVIHFNQSHSWKRHDCQFVSVTPLLRELITAMSNEAGKQLSRRIETIAELMIDELEVAQSAGLPIPMPDDSRLKALFRKVINQPASHATLNELASSVGLTPKTATRLCHKEMGMNFRDWREMMHAASAMAYFSQGASVKAVSSLLGYTPSAFSTMMRRYSGTSPRDLKVIKAADDPTRSLTAFG